jgi:hypothetical protein
VVQVIVRIEATVIGLSSLDLKGSGDNRVKMAW